MAFFSQHARRRPRLRWLLLLGLCGAVLAASAQLMPDAPVVNFRLPMFGDDGHLDWDLRGQEGVLSGEQVEVRGMRLLVFDDEQPERVEMEMISPKATVLIPERQVRGEETITLVGDNFIITGERWAWDSNDNRVVIDEKVKVTFFEELTGILK
jgi:lipopolysaccharide export system protein LptC